MTAFTRLAPAKVNLYLHVAAPDGRGYHPLQSLVVFADVGDEIALVPKASGDNLPLHLSIDGPFGAGLGTGEDNLVLKAVRSFEEAAGVNVDRHDIYLTKNLPIASGIGGGSADAGAVLHLLREAYAPDMADEDLEAIAGRTGADGVMCLWARTSVAEGYGERLTPANVPAVSAVLVNPLAECATPAVFARYDSRQRFDHLDPGDVFDGVTDFDGLVSALRTTRNDLEEPAMALVPVITNVLSALADQPEAILARMSGSGATCFALCRDDAAAEALRRRLEGMWPAAWVRACRLGQA